MGYIDRSKVYRQFDSLHIPTVGKTDCVYHISSYLEDKEGVSDRVNTSREFEVFRLNIDHLLSQTISQLDGFRMDLIVSINGHISNPTYIEYLNSINGTNNGKVFITVFQRPNVGYQWGGLHDVWLRYKDVKCTWYVTTEADVYMEDDIWYDTAVHKVNASGNGYLGQNARINMIHPFEAESSPGMWYIGDSSPLVWRNGNGDIIKPTKEMTQHTRGGFYFCCDTLLRRMDEVYGNFTFSMGCNHEYDGIILGEVGFCHKITALGYKLFKNEDMVRVRE
jgi:hypothetical protein